MSYTSLKLLTVIGITMHIAHGMESSSKKINNGFESLSHIMRKIGDHKISEHDEAFKLLWVRYDTLIQAIEKNKNPFLKSKFDAQAFELAKEFKSGLDSVLNRKTTRI